MQEFTAKSSSLFTARNADKHRGFRAKGEE